jgi:hypothetical protein
VDCVGNPIFLVGVNILIHLLHAMCFKEEGNTNCFWSPHFFDVHRQDFLQVILEKLNGDHLDLSLLNTFALFLPKS